MEKISKKLRPFARASVIFSCWALCGLNIYLFWKPLSIYAASNGLNATPDVLDSIIFYNAEQGYEILRHLGEEGRHAYRLANYSDFILPIFVFLSLSLPNLALNKANRHIVYPLIYLLSDYLENLAEKYVLEIYPQRNDFIMNLSCYLGVVKIFFVVACLLLLIFNSFSWMVNQKHDLKTQ